MLNRLSRVFMMINSVRSPLIRGREKTPAK